MSSIKRDVKKNGKNSTVKPGWDPAPATTTLLGAGNES
jgi:hypothetical protein